MKKGDRLELLISDMAFGGKGISRQTTEAGDYVFFVESAIPGQTVLVQVTKKRKKYAECRLLEVIKPSDSEKETPYQPISGAPYLSLSIEDQIDYKKRTTLDVLRKIGGIQSPADYFDSFIESPNTWFYRNKMEYSFSSIRHDLMDDQEYDDFALGFKRRGTWWKVENLDKASGLFDESFENALHSIRTYCESTGLPAWHPPKKTGFFRHIVVRKSFAQDKLLINLVTSSEGIERFDQQGFLKVLQSILGERLAGFQHTRNDNVADRAKIENGNTDLVYGDSVIVEEMFGLKFEISMESFFQTNPSCAERLYAKTIEYALESNNLEDNVIMDLFCGTGTIGQIIAKSHPSAKIIGVDIVPEAIENAQRNAQMNGIDNVTFFAADVGKFLNQYPEYKGNISTIILDPPRAGIAPKSLKKVMDLGANRIVYVSCNPATQARDLNELDQYGYKLVKFSLCDQFPHTAHIESIALLEKKP